MMTEKQFNSALTLYSSKFMDGVENLKELKKLLLIEKKDKSLIQFTNIMEKKVEELRILLKIRYGKK